MGTKDNEPARSDSGKSAHESIKAQLTRDLQEKAGTEKAHAGATERAAPRVPMWRRSFSGLFGVVRRREVLAFCQELALLMECGMPLLKALRTLAGRARNTAMARAITDIADDVEQGRSFSQAVAEHGRYFPQTIISMLRAGEASGRLEQMLTSVARHGERVTAIRNKAISMLIYPALVILCAIIVITVVFGVLADGFNRLAELAGEPPWSMKTLLAIGAWFHQPAFWATAVIVVAGVIIGYVVAMRFIAFRLLRDRFLVRFPGVRHFVKQGLLVNFARIFSAMLQSGVRMQESLQATRDACGNEILRLTLERVQGAVQRGERITPELERGGVFPPLAYDLCAVAEEAGALDRVLSRLSEVYEEKQATETEMLGKLVQPAIVIVLAFIVGFIIFAFFSMYTSAFAQIGAL